MTFRFELCLVALALCACSSGLSASSRASVADGGAESAPSASTLSCKDTVDAYCSQATCEDLAHARALLPTAYPPNTAFPDASASQCGEYTVVSKYGTDTSTTTFFDTATGRLVAVVHSVNGTETCLAASAGFSAPGGCVVIGTYCAATEDAGVDAAPTH
jgi:hypothetical protein